MAKKQTRRSISVSRTTYERLKAFCETSGISMSQFVETRVGDFLGEDSGVVSAATAGLAQTERPVRSMTAPQTARPQPAPMRSAAAPARPTPAQRPVPMTSAAARFAVDPPPPIIKKSEQTAPKAPSMPKADQIFTF
jgi:hypothetical protein